jgi:hypothetical protein
MTENQLKLFEILGDYVDKELKFGCIVRWKTTELTWARTYYAIKESFWYRKVKNWKIHWNNCWVARPYKMKILWQIHHSNILRYCINNKCYIESFPQRLNLKNEWYFPQCIKIQWMERFDLDITKEPLEYTEEYLLQLNLFLEKIK